MPHDPDYTPPFCALPQSADEMARVSSRWMESMKAVEGRYGPPKNPNDPDAELKQCGGCQYYIPLEGSIGADWGACSNPKSAFDSRTVFEHHGCSSFSYGKRIKLPKIRAQAIVGHKNGSWERHVFAFTPEDLSDYSLSDGLDRVARKAYPDALFIKLARYHPEDIIAAREAADWIVPDWQKNNLQQAIASWEEAAK